MSDCNIYLRRDVYLQTVSLGLLNCEINASIYSQAFNIFLFNRASSKPSSLSSI